MLAGNVSAQVLSFFVHESGMLDPSAARWKRWINVIFSERFICIGVPECASKERRFEFELLRSTTGWTDQRVQFVNETLKWLNV